MKEPFLQIGMAEPFNSFRRNLPTEILKQLISDLDSKELSYVAIYFIVFTLCYHRQLFL